MTTVTRAYVASRHGQLHYRIAHPEQASAAPPLLCLHQTPGNGHDWQPILPTLAERRTVIAIDTPGYGMSDPPAAPLEIADFADIMAQAMTDLAAQGVIAGGPFDVMGMHTGSVTSTQLAVAFPDRIRRAILFGLAAYPADVREQKLARLRDHFPVPTNDLTHVEKLWAVISTLSDPRVTGAVVYAAAGSGRWVAFQPYHAATATTISPRMIQDRMPMFVCVPYLRT